MFGEISDDSLIGISSTCLKTNQPVTDVIENDDLTYANEVDESMIIGADNDDSLIGINFECSNQPVTDLIETDQFVMSNNSKRVKTSNDDLTYVNEVDECMIIGADNADESEKVYLDFDLENEDRQEIAAEEESLIIDKNSQSDDTGDISDHVEIDYTDYEMLPICVDEADEVACTLDTLIRQGKVPKDGIFYKYLKGVLQVYVTPLNIHGILMSLSFLKL